MKKRQNEDTTPPSMSRQPKTKRNDEGNEAEKKDQTQRELFPAQPSSYKIYYTKEHQKGKEPRWKQQQATVEERILQAQTPQTAKKPATASKEATDLNRQLAEQIAVAQQTLNKMQQNMESTQLPPYVHEMQQQIIDLQQNLQHLERDRDAQYRHQGCRHFSPTCPRHALLTPTKRSCKPNSGQRMATGIHRGRAGQCPSVVHRKGRGRRTVHNNPRQIQLRVVSQITNYHSPLEHPTSQTYL